MMQKISLLLLAVSLVSCSDNDKLGNGKPDAGHGDHEEVDSGANTEDAGATPAASNLERPPGNLQRPPGKKLPDDLKPPGYAK